MTQNEQVAVEQIDREAAADILDEVSNLLDHVGIGQVADLIRDGEYDEHEVVRLTARHRTRALEASQAPESEAVEWTDERMKFLRESAEEMLDHKVQYTDPVFAFGQACVNYGFSLTTPTRIEASQPQEAVAWLYELFDMKEVHMQRLPERISWKETPLYATPTRIEAAQTPNFGDVESEFCSAIEAAQPQEAVGKRYVNYEGHPELGSPNRNHPLQAKRTGPDDPPIQAAESGLLDEAARIAYFICAETRHVSLGNKVSEAILALAKTGKPQP